ncbi:pentatricopeptide repeat-containing protein At1g62670, mitochondrial-like [Pistacia vera]|uniref:pentatricopeptide repeat-containing protein At1g62670, mitochondrial-like n=1 Tax=Pistacia vera TaxID=55513 RepID=UPI001262BDFB|nr:pentatricopeptide repeat-containing protein At1g62670, mitochondrial-like [Pistacia vera]
MAYDKLADDFLGFITNLSIVKVPAPVHEALRDEKWRKTADGTVERYKARLAAKGFMQTYGVDYEVTFAPMAKLNNIRVLVSCSKSRLAFTKTRFEKNAFLNGELAKEVYMEMPLGVERSGKDRKVNSNGLASYACGKCEKMSLVWKMSEEEYEEYHLVSDSFAVFGAILKKGFSPNVVTFNCLIKGKISVAIKLLEEMVNGNKESSVICRLDVVTYNTIIDGLCKAGLVEKARQLFLEHMIQRAKVKDARNLVGEIGVNDVFLDSWTYDIFINGLCKNGFSIVGLNSLIDGLCKTKRLATAWDLFQKFSLHGNLVPDFVTYNILISGLCKNGQLEMANELLSYMEEKGCAPNVVTFTTLMLGFLKNNEIPKVVEPLHKMVERNVMPTECTMSLVMQLLMKAKNYRECLNDLPQFPVQKQN